MSTLYPFVPATPEELGIPSRSIIKFIETVEKQNINLHGFMVVRHGKVAAEGYWKPFNADHMHCLYSTSKSFTSTAIGLLIGDGKVHLDDKVVDYFPEYVPENAHPFLLNATIRNLLMMATPYENGTNDWDDPSWVATFFNKCQPTHPAGTLFHYDTSGTHTLGVIVERVTGMKLMDFLYERILKDMGSDDDLWCIKAPEGYSWGGAGVVAELRDLARLAYLWLNKGKFNGKQYIPEDYIVDGSSNLIDTCLLGHHCHYHHHGYGYQVWQAPHNAFAFVGMATQYAICWRDKDLMVIVTGNTLQEPSDEERVCPAILDSIYDALSDEPLPADDEAYAALQQRIENMELPVPFGEKYSPVQEQVSDITYELDPNNRMGVKDMQFHFSPDGETGSLIYTNEQGVKQINFGMAKYVEGRFPQWGYCYDTFHKPSDHLYHCLSAANWVRPDSLQLTVWLEDVLCGLVTIRTTFTEDNKLIATMWTKSAPDCLNEYWGNGYGYIKK